MKTLKRVTVVLLSFMSLQMNFGKLFASEHKNREVNPNISVEALSPIGEVRALVVYAAFMDDPQDELPAWTDDIFDPNVPNSLAHYYHVQSNGKHKITGEVLDHWVYANFNRYPSVNKDQFVLSVLEQIDQEIDFSKYDNWKGSQSHEPDGKVDIIFINIANSLFQSMASLELKSYPFCYETNDTWAGGKVKIYSQSGTCQFAQKDLEHQTSGMAHEYGHILGLVDLYDLSYYECNPSPDEYSAGIGFWGLMSEGYGVWGLYSMCEFHKAQLGWNTIVNITENIFDLQVKPDTIYKVCPKVFNEEEYFLITYRDHENYYDRKLPKGMLIWHVDESQKGYKNRYEMHKYVDLECADGLFSDMGFPGNISDPVNGRDNLDYWAKHYQEYTGAHHGNTYDSTDVFDGINYSSFTAYTNPNTNGYNGDSQSIVSHLAITNIRPDGMCDIIMNYWIGRITTNTRWMKEDGPYFLGGDIIVPEGVSFVIEPDAVVNLNGYRIIRRTKLPIAAESIPEIYEEKIIPIAWELFQNYPNPFNSTTAIQFCLNEISYVSLKIYNANGQRIRTVCEKNYSQGNASEIWDGKNDNGQSVSSGNYHCVMQIGNQMKSKKIMLIK